MPPIEVLGSGGGPRLREELPDPRRRSPVTALRLELLKQPGARGRQVHHANIMATIRHYGIPNLLTHKTADFERYQSWITVMPLVI
jgi:hypothetical protein